ncbi:UBX domain-containing protein [Prunus dulcis]|uniref:UBX domain-containing protein n=1 Tax=Prunus dulcis TaxID=3755 RepID=A0A4Y1RHL7_PRUDU|nr:UBX domain-containing protein [Prunus dulcis]
MNSLDSEMMDKKMDPLSTILTMSSAMREGVRSAGEASHNGIVRRMVSLPRSIIGGFSRAMGHRRGLIGRGGRKAQTLPSNFQLQQPEEPLIGLDVSAFLPTFEQQYGTMHPFFYACHFMEALKISEGEHKFLFMYLHSPEHPFTPSFCRETLSSELVVQFLDANFVSWEHLLIEGKMEGPISPTELVGILQRTVEEQGSAFRSSKVKQAEAVIADRRLREEQDAAYLAALQLDKEKEKLKNLPPADRAQKPAEAPTKAKNETLQNYPTKQQYGKTKEASSTREAQYKEVANRGRILRLLHRY